MTFGRLAARFGIPMAGGVANSGRTFVNGVLRTADDISAQGECSGNMPATRGLLRTAGDTLRAYPPGYRAGLALYRTLDEYTRKPY